MPSDHNVLRALKQEIADWHLWTGRAVVIAFAALAGLTVVAFTSLTEGAFSLFTAAQSRYAWAPLVWTPLCTAGIVAATRRYFPGAAGSGIPQVMAALDTSVAAQQRGLFVSLRLTLAKMGLTAWGLLAGLSLGREGPSVQIAAGVMHHARRWLPKKAAIHERSLLIAGGAAGIAAAFNTPLGGVMFAIEELSKDAEQRSTSLILVAIVMGGLMGVSAFGNASYFGVIRAQALQWDLLLPALAVIVTCGLAGGVFSRLLISSLSGLASDRLSRFRRQSPVWFAAGCGLAVAIAGWVTQGEIHGGGYTHTRAMLEGANDSNVIYGVLKFVTTWLTAWAGVPGGLFAPSLAIGGALGNDIATLAAQPHTATLIALGMAGFLAAVTQAPMTAFIIVMEMVDGHGLVLSLMMSALISSGVSRLLSVPLYPALAALQLQRLPPGCR